MLRDVIPSTKRKARTYLLDDHTTLTAVDPLPFEQYAEYPIKKRAIIRLPRPFRRHRKILQRNLETKSRQDSERFVAEFDDKDKKLVATPDAILGIHILELDNVSLRVTSFDRSVPMYFYCVVSVGKKRKMTKVVLATTPERVRVDASLYFSFDVSNVRDNYRNTLKIEIWTFQDPNTHFVIGAKEIHIYTLIQQVHSIDVHHIWAEGLHAASFIYEYAFAYGLYGFGHSNQLKNTKSSVFESICHSMFPRIRLQEADLVDNKFNIRVPKKIQMIGMSNFLLYAPEVTPNKSKKQKEEAGEDDVIEPKFFCLHHVEFDRGQPIFAKVNIKMNQEEFEADFNEIYGEFICISSRRERLEFLQQLVYGRMEDIRETEVGALFQELDFDTAENVIRAEDTVQGFLHPKTMPCTSYPRAFVEPTDEPIYETIPSASRTSGWLSRIFGYSPMETDPHYGEEEYPFEYVRGYSRHRTPRWQVFLHGLKFVWGRLTHLVIVFIQFVLPELRSDMEIPDVAVTLPSPTGSTTDLYVSWVSDEREQFQHATASRRTKDPVQEAYEAVSRLLYDEYDKDAHMTASDIDLETIQDQKPSSNADKAHMEPSPEGDMLLASGGKSIFGEYHNAGFLALFYSIMDSPLAIWQKQDRNGDIRRAVDEDSYLALELCSNSDGNIYTTFLTTPTLPYTSLGVSLPILVLIIKNMGRKFGFTVQIRDEFCKRRLLFSNHWKTHRVKPRCAYIPVTLERGWNELRINLEDLTRIAYGTNYTETVRVQIHANCRLRMIYFSATPMDVPVAVEIIREILPKLSDHKLPNSGHPSHLLISANEISLLQPAIKSFVSYQDVSSPLNHKAHCSRSCPRMTSDMQTQLHDLNGQELDSKEATHAETILIGRAIWNDENSIQHSSDVIAPNPAKPATQEVDRDDVVEKLSERIAEEVIMSQYKQLTTSEPSFMNPLNFFTQKEKLVSEGVFYKHRILGQSHCMNGFTHGRLITYISSPKPNENGSTPILDDSNSEDRRINIPALKDAYSVCRDSHNSLAFFEHSPPTPIPTTSSLFALALPSTQKQNFETPNTLTSSRQLETSVGTKFLEPPLPLKDNMESFEANKILSLSLAVSNFCSMPAIYDSISTDSAIWKPLMELQDFGCALDKNLTLGLALSIPQASIPQTSFSTYKFAVHGSMPNRNSSSAQKSDGNSKPEFLNSFMDRKLMQNFASNAKKKLSLSTTAMDKSPYESILVKINSKSKSETDHIKTKPIETDDDTMQQLDEQLEKLECVLKGLTHHSGHTTVKNIPSSTSIHSQKGQSTTPSIISRMKSRIADMKSQLAKLEATFDRNREEEIEAYPPMTIRVVSNPILPGQFVPSGILRLPGKSPSTPTKLKGKLSVRFAKTEGKFEPIRAQEPPLPPKTTVPVLLGSSLNLPTFSNCQPKNN